ncbi:MAG: AMP-binding protein, partial [Brachybacterium tyrofermentans]
MLPVSATLRARVALAPRSVVLIDKFGELTAQELLAQAQLHRHRPGSALPGRGHSPWNLLPAHAPLRQIMVTVLASDAPLELRSSGTPERLSPRRRGPLSPSQFLTLLDLGRRIGLRPGRRVASAAPGVHG